MTNGDLTWKKGKAGLRVTCLSRGAPIPVKDWASATVIGALTRRPVKPGILLGTFEALQEAGVLDDYLDSKEVELPSRVIASFADHELDDVGLYPAVPYVLWVDIKGAVSTDTFELLASWRTTKGRPLMGVKRDGCLLAVGEKQFILTEPFYSLLEARDEVQRRAGGAIPDTMDAFARFQEHLPESARLSSGLKRMKVVRANAASLLPVIGKDGQPDFRVRLLQRGGEDSPLPDSEGDQSVLPEEPESHFQRRFREFPDGRRVYPVDGGWYVVASEPLAKVLSATRKAADLRGEDMRGFLRNPAGFLREQLEDELDEEALGEIFREPDGYSERVREIGIWEPKVLPWISSSGQDWLPDEEGRGDRITDVGIRVGDRVTRIEKQDLPGLVTEVEDAIEAGKSAVVYKDEEIPATPAVRDALKELLNRLEDREPAPVPAGDDPKARVAVLIRDNLEQLQYRAAPRPAKEAAGGFDDVLSTSPLPHQEEALEWLGQHWRSGSTGALLADDMGLGKTLVGLAFMAWARKQGGKGPCLVVAPTGLLQNWTQEHDKHLESPGLGDSLIARGAALRDLKVPGSASGAETGRKAGFASLDLDRIKRAGFVLASYEAVRDYQHSFSRVPWSVVIMDEAQKIKNPGALMTDAAKALQSDFTLIMTGTPVENRMADLWSLLDTIQPGRFGALAEFVRLYDAEAENARESLQELNRSLLETRENSPAIMLRRLKKDHLKGLPERQFHTLREEMPPPQASAYTELIRRERPDVDNRGAMLALLQHLKQASLHPEPGADLEDDAFILASARLRSAVEVLDRAFHQGEKTLLFLESRDMQKRLLSLLQRRYNLDRPPMVINGAVAGSARQDRVETFQSASGPGVMVLSPRAAGVGLTLTAANHVIHLSRWWNPAVEDQCTDRVYRIGQERDVHVYLPLAVHPEYGERSFDLRLDALLAAKRQLSQAALAPVGESKGDIDGLIADVIGGRAEEIGNLEGALRGGARI